MFKVQSDYSVIEGSGLYNAIGSGSEVALGSLYTSLKLYDIYGDTYRCEEAVRLALEASASSSNYVRPPFTILSV